MDHVAVLFAAFFAQKFCIISSFFIIVSITGIKFLFSKFLM